MSSTELTNQDPVTIAEIRAIAQSRLPGPVWDYYATGADDEETLQRNSAVFQEYGPRNPSPSLSTNSD
jgi:hypothetical protein